MQTTMQARPNPQSSPLCSKRTLTTTKSSATTDPSSSQKQSPLRSCSTRHDIELLWKKLLAMYGRAFSQQYGIKADEAGIWQTALSLLSKHDIEYGVKKLMLTNKYTTFPPNPMQFRELCLSRRDSLRLPSLKDAYIEARNFHDTKDYVWTHHAVKFCAVKLGGEALRSPYEKKLFKDFKALYEKVCLAVEQGISLPDVQVDVEPASQHEGLGVGEYHLYQIKTKLRGGVH